ncbi:ABC transporter ATP-binding protein [Pseudovibrio sp. Ad37]|uniref:ABC transporter ATP-binding protein n=1 Tax=Pseudovibrio sp. Ad37 TaxID=989422 RepID=UPI0007AE8DCD|nr:ABC transporter ATP-binding protein [Pseudovibrio sp. Ad37]KZL28770.1 Iron(3+)-hydroxamate import ATP-binding protein FhuC [Pseudovibrio sp. Ad37]
MSAAFVSVRDVSWAPDRKSSLVLQPLSFELAAGQVLGVVGANGAGKSTLLRLLYRFNKPMSGQICVGGDDIWSLSAKVTAQRVAAVLQEQPTDFALKVREIVELGRTPYRSGLAASGERDRQVVDRAIRALQLDGLAGRLFGTLSGGERQRVMVARALAQEPELLILDEPTNHLDIRHQLEILKLIEELDLTIITSLHDLNMAAEVCDQILLLDHGQMLGFGAPEQILSPALVSKAFQVRTTRDQLVDRQHSLLTFNLHS